MKRLRKAKGAGIRFFACGEYGDVTERPHYHVILFNCVFEDAYVVGKNLLESPLVGRLWPFGGHRIGSFSGASASYVAQYTLKKFGREYCDADGVVKVAPFVRMSRNPGIGSEWLKKYAGDLKAGYMVVDGRKVGIPRAYRLKLSAELKEMVELRQSEHRRSRIGDGQEPARLEAAEKIHFSRKKMLASRSL